jgi:purine nucleosidase
MSPLPVIIDCDPGVDDAVAILLALASPELDVLGITTVAGNVAADLTAKNARKACELAGRRDMAVFAGCEKPLLRLQVFGKYAAGGGLAGDTLPEPTMPLGSLHAVDFLRTTLIAPRPARVTLCTLGPLTNVAVALALDPGIAGRIERIVAMGGAFAAFGNRSPAAEFNVLADPHAAQIVLQSGVAIDLLPLDLTFQALATPDWLAEVRKLGRVGAAVHQLLTFFDRSDIARFGRPGGPLHDPLVIASLLWPEIFSGRSAWVGVDLAGQGTLGHTCIDWRCEDDRAANVRVLTRVAPKMFFPRLKDRLAGYWREGLVPES